MLRPAPIVRKVQAAHGPLLTYCLFVVFGVSSWVTINGIFAQLPIFASTLPEGCKQTRNSTTSPLSAARGPLRSRGLPAGLPAGALGSQLGLVVQLANLGPIAYLLLRKR